MRQYPPPGVWPLQSRDSPAAGRIAGVAPGGHYEMQTVCASNKDNMGWRRLVLWSVCAFAILMAAVLTWLWTADLGVIKPQLERWVSQQAGRTLAIDGPLSVTLGRQSVLKAAGVRLENADWAEPADMVSVGTLEVRLDTWSLINGPIRIELVDLDDAQIHLIRPADGDPNWVLPIGEAVESDRSVDDERALDLLVKQIDIDRVQVVYQSDKRTRPLSLRIENFDQVHRDDGLLELDLRADLDDRDIQVRGEIGTFQALINGRDVRFDLQGQLDTFEFEASGRIDDLVRPFRPTVQFAAKGPSIDDLSSLLGLEEEGQGDIDLVGSLMPQQDGPLVLEINGNLGQTDIEASGAFSDLRDLDQIDIDLLASGPDLGRILSLAGIHQVREAPFMIDLDIERQGSAVVIRQGQMLFGDARFDLSAQVPNFPGFDDSTINLQIAGPDLERFRYVLDLPGAATGPFSLSFVVAVDPRGVEIIELVANTTLGSLRADGELGLEPNYIGTKLKFQLSSDSLARLAGAYGLPDLPDRPVRVTGAAELTPAGIQTQGPVVVEVNQVTAKADGLVTLVPGITGSQLAFDLAGPDLAQLSAAFGVTEGVPQEPYQLAGQLQIQRAGYRFADIAGSIGTSSVTLDGLLTTQPGLAGTRMTFQVGGPAFEEVIERLGELAVRPGPYALEGSVLLQEDRAEFQAIELERESGEIALDLVLGLPLSRWWADFDLLARGPDVRSVLSRIEDFEAEQATFSVAARGELRGRSLDLDRLDVAIGDARAEARGELQFEEDAADTRFSLTGSIPSLARLGRFNGRRLRDQPFAWDAQVRGRDGVIRVDGLLAELGDSDVNGNIVYRLGDVPELNIDINSASIVLAPLPEQQSEEYDPEPTFNDGRLIPDMPIPLEAMKRLNGTASLRIGEFQRDALHLRDIRLRAELRDGALDVAELGFLARSGSFEGKARIGPFDDTAQATVEVSARDFALGASSLNQNLEMTGDVDLRLEATGADLRTLLGSANGVLLTDIRGGKIANNRFLQAIYGDVLDEVLSAINPFSKSDPYTSIECVIFPLQIIDGQVTGNPASFISTDKIRLTTRSSVDLKTEKLEMNIRTTPRRALSVSAGELLNPYIKVTGTLASPKLAVDEKGVLVTGGAAVATGGLSVLARAAWDRLSRAGDACKNASDQGRKALAQRYPGLLESREIPADMGDAKDTAEIP